jgi:hypothetical protein
MSSGELRTYVINLDRRPDRLNRIQTSLKSRGIDFVRVEAVDGTKQIQAVSTSRFISPGSSANWSSIQAVFSQFLASEAEYALVLEDDANVADSSISQEKLRQWIETMKTLKLSLLQVGFIGHLYKITRPRGLLDLVLAYRRRAVVWSQNIGGNVVLGEFRAGAHAFIVDRVLAKELLAANQPPYLASDNFLESLARNDSNKIFGRLFTSAIEQVSRVEPNQKLDSDI